MAFSDAVLGDLSFFMYRKETTWGQEDGAGTDIAHPFYGGNFGLTPEDPDREQPHVDGNLDTTFVVQDTRDLTGPLEVGVYPDLIDDVLDWAWTRSGGNGQSATTTLVYPGLVARKAYGVMVNQLTLDFADDDDLRCTLDLRGKYEELVTGGSMPAYGSFTFPSRNSMTFKNCRFLVSVDDLSTEIVPVGLESGQIVISNNLVMGPHEEDRVNLQKDGTISWLRSGKKQVSGQIVVLLDRIAIPRGMERKYKISLRVMAAHPDGAATTVGGAGGSAGANVNLTVADSSNFSVGDVVRFDTAAEANRSVGVVGAVPDGTHITIATLDKDVASGDYVYNDAAEFRVAKARITRIDYAQDPGDLIKATINFRGIALSASDELFTWKAKAA